MIQKHTKIRLCPDCGSEKRHGVCLLCGEGERTLPWSPLPNRHDFNSLNSMINYYLGTSKKEA